MPKIKKVDQKQKMLSVHILKLIVLKLVVFPPLVVVLVSYCIYCSWSGIQSMVQFYFTGAHLEGRGLIFSKMRQICIKDKLQILQQLHIKMFEITTVSREG